MSSILDIQAEGFLKKFLNTQMEGLTGHIGEAGYPFDCVEWGAEDTSPETKNETWWRYEQVSYWLDGYTRCAILLRDEKAIANAKRIIYNVINNPNGTYLGPSAIMGEGKGWNRWPHVVFFRACMAMYDYTGDEKIPRAIEAHYVNDIVDYGRNRDVLNVEVLLWCYGITKNEKLRQMAEDAYAKYHENCETDACNRAIFSSKKPHVHGVTYNELNKLGAILYAHTGKKEYLAAAKRAFEKAEKYFLLPNGCICSNEYTLGNNYYNSTETCNVSDFTWALQYLLKATKDPHYSDLIERCIFNAGMGCITEDFRALQYFSCANQVISDHQSNHNYYAKGREWMQYAPNPGTECCPGNVNRFMPNYLLNMWANEDDRVYCYLYGASTYRAEIGGKTVLIKETTGYPAEDSVHFEIKTETPFRFLYRFPEFMSKCTVKLNGKEIEGAEKGRFNELLVEKDSVVDIVFDAEIVPHVEKERIYFTRGALTYTLAMKGDRRTEVEPDRTFPTYSMYADEEWRYAIKKCKPTYTPCESFEEFRLGTPLPSLKVKAVRIKNMDLTTVYHFMTIRNPETKEMKRIDGKRTFTPRLMPTSKLKLADEVEEITLYPYGTGKLRMTVFNLVD